MLDCSCVVNECDILFYFVGTHHKNMLTTFQVLHLLTVGTQDLSMSMMAKVAYHESIKPPNCLTSVWLHGAYNVRKQDQSP